MQLIGDPVAFTLRRLISVASTSLEIHFLAIQIPFVEQMKYGNILDGPTLLNNLPSPSR